MDRTATSATREKTPILWLSGLTFVCAWTATACEGDTKKIIQGGDDPGAMPTPTEVAPDEEAPTLEPRITEISGASGPNGEFLVGDRITVRFGIAQADGSPWQLGELGEAEALVSGPTFGYQRVIPVQTDVATAAVELDDGFFLYTFPALPATYAAPYNDSASFGRDEGERTGDALVDGTYSLGFSFTWEYTVDGKQYRRVGEITRDFLLGTGSGALSSRAVTSADNCNQCHTTLEAHEGRYRT